MPLSVKKRVLAAVRFGFLAVCIAYSVLFLGQSLGDWAADHQRWSRQSGDSYVGQGKALIHGIADPIVSACMPVSSVANVYLSQSGLPSPSQLVGRGLILLLSLFLVFVLARLLHSKFSGALAAIIAAPILAGFLYTDRCLYNLHILAVACVLVWRAQAPSRPRSLLLGVVLGGSLLVLSPLFLFPIVLLLYEWGCPRPVLSERSKKSISQSMVVLITPFVLLIPWVLMNWQIHHRFILFEDGRADILIRTGALGYVSAILGNHDFILSGHTSGSGTFVWATKWILLHPLSYLLAYGKRLLYAVSLHPVLYSGGLVGAWLLRQREESRQLALLIVYFIGIHCLMSVEERYFSSILPLLSAFAGCAVSYWLAPRDEQIRRYAAVGVFSVVLLPLAALHLYVIGLVLAYPGRASSHTDLSQRLKECPLDAWLWVKQGTQQLSEGRIAEAATDFSRALALDPQFPGLRRQYALARIVLGNGGRDIWERFLHPERLDDLSALSGYSYLIISRLQAGRVAAALGTWQLMRDLALSAPDDFRAEGPARGRMWQRDAIARNTPIFESALLMWPESARQGLRVKINHMMTQPPVEPRQLVDLWIGEARSVMLSGQREAAGDALGRAVRLEPRQDQRRRIAQMFGECGEYVLALSALENGAKAGDNEVIVLQGLADSAFGAGRTAAARRLLDYAGSLPQRTSQRRNAARLYARIGDYSRAMSEIRRIPRRGPPEVDVLLGIAQSALQAHRQDEVPWILNIARTMHPDERQSCRIVDIYPDPAGNIGLLLELGDARLSCGDRRTALDFVARAMRQEPGLNDQHRAALILQRAGEHEKALQIFDQLVRQYPRQARWRSDRGVLYVLKGRNDLAIRDLYTAISIDPTFLPPYLSLGTLHASSGRLHDASRVFRQALAQPVFDGPVGPACQNIRDRIRAEYKKIMRQ